MLQNQSFIGCVCHAFDLHLTLLMVSRPCTHYTRNPNTPKTMSFANLNPHRSLKHVVVHQHCDFEHQAFHRRCWNWPLNVLALGSLLNFINIVMPQLADRSGQRRPLRLKHCHEIEMACENNLAAMHAGHQVKVMHWCIAFNLHTNHWVYANVILAERCGWDVSPIRCNPDQTSSSVVRSYIVRSCSHVDARRQAFGRCSTDPGVLGEEPCGSHRRKVRGNASKTLRSLGAKDLLDTCVPSCVYPIMSTVTWKCLCVWSSWFHLTGNISCA